MSEKEKMAGEKRFSHEFWKKKKKAVFWSSKMGATASQGAQLEKTKWVMKNLSWGGVGAQLRISAVHLVLQPQCSQTSRLVSHLPILWLPHYFLDFLLLCSFQWEGNARMETIVISDILYFFARHSSSNKLLGKLPLYAWDLEFHP